MNKIVMYVVLFCLALIGLCVITQYALAMLGVMLIVAIGYGINRIVKFFKRGKNETSKTRCPYPEYRPTEPDDLHKS